MKIQATLFLALAVVTTTMASNADSNPNSISRAEPFANSSSRGQIAAILSFCTRIYPSGRERCCGLEKLLLGADGQEDRFEGSADYRKAFEAANEGFAKISPAQALGLQGGGQRLNPMPQWT